MGAAASDVFIGTSLGPASDAVVETGVSFSRSLGATARLVHAAAPDPNPAEREAILRRLHGQARRLGLEGPDRVDLYSEAGTAPDVLLRAARGPGAVLVIGGRETAGWLGRPLGSVARQVLARAQCPVLVARGPLRDLEIVRRTEGAGPLALWARRALLGRIGRSAGSVLVLPADLDPCRGLEGLEAWRAEALHAEMVKDGVGVGGKH